ncbi:hypothetical protein DK926_05105 [Rhodococcus sp. Eu-32]|nr:hypothetical protein DK926_05105 [Rhodococcus sp. Eu-32]
MAVVSVGAAIASVATAPRNIEPVAQPTPTSPGALWTVDAADALGSEFATFEDLVGGRFAGIEGGVVDAGAVLVAKTGLTNQETGEFEKAHLIGIDSSTGDIRWKTPADGVDTCSTALLNDMILCRTDGAIVTVNATDGTITRHPTEWNVFSVTSDGTDIFAVEGEPDGYTVRIHRGTLDDPDAQWSLTLDDTWTSDFTTGDMIRLAGTAGEARLASATVLFDTESGELIDRFSSPDCARARVDREDAIFVIAGRRCSDLFEFHSDLVDSTGRVVAGVDTQVDQRVYADTTHGNDPIMFDGAAIDPSTGERLWADENLRGEIAIVDGVVISGYAPARDLRTGAELWTPDDETGSTLPTAEHDGLAYLVGWQDILTVDPATGARRASVSIDGLLGNTQGRSQEVALQESERGILVVNETRLSRIP